MSEKYTEYISEHCKAVRDAWTWLSDHNLLPEEVKTKYNVYTHDNSKHTKEEYDAYDNYFYGEKTEEVKTKFNYAWLHHIHNNPHHWQHWVLVNDDDGTHALEMPAQYVYEMICDWWSFSFRKGDLKEVFKWYEDHKSNMILHPNTKALVEDILYKQIKPILEEVSQ